MEVNLAARTLSALGEHAAPVEAMETAMHDLVLQSPYTRGAVADARDAKVGAATKVAADWLDGVVERYGPVLSDWQRSRYASLAGDVRKLPRNFPHDYPWVIRDAALRAYDGVVDAAVAVRALDSLGGPEAVARAGSVGELAGVDDAIRGVGLALAREDLATVEAGRDPLRRLALHPQPDHDRWWRGSREPADDLPGPKAHTEQTAAATRAMAFGMERRVQEAARISGAGAYGQAAKFGQKLHELADQVRGGVRPRELYDSVEERWGKVIGKEIEFEAWNGDLAAVRAEVEAGVPQATAFLDGKPNFTVVEARAKAWIAASAGRTGLAPTDDLATGFGLWKVPPSSISGVRPRQDAMWKGVAHELARRGDSALADPGIRALPVERRYALQQAAEAILRHDDIAHYDGKLADWAGSYATQVADVIEAGRAAGGVPVELADPLDHVVGAARVASRMDWKAPVPNLAAADIAAELRAGADRWRTGSAGNGDARTRWIGELLDTGSAAADELAAGGSDVMALRRRLAAVAGELDRIRADPSATIMSPRDVAAWVASSPASGDASRASELAAGFDLLSVQPKYLPDGVEGWHRLQSQVATSLQSRLDDVLEAGAAAGTSPATRLQVRLAMRDAMAATEPSFFSDGVRQLRLAAAREAAVHAADLAAGAPGTQLWTGPIGAIELMQDLARQASSSSRPLDPATRMEFPRAMDELGAAVHQYALASPDAFPPNALHAVDQLAHAFEPWRTATGVGTDLQVGSVVATVSSILRSLPQLVEFDAAVSVLPKVEAEQALAEAMASLQDTQAALLDYHRTPHNVGRLYDSLTLVRRAVDTMRPALPDGVLTGIESHLDDGIVDAAVARAAVARGSGLPESSYPKLATLGRLHSDLRVLDEIRDMQAAASDTI